MPNNDKLARAGVHIDSVSRSMAWKDILYEIGVKLGTYLPFNLFNRKTNKNKNNKGE